MDLKSKYFTVVLCERMELFCCSVLTHIRVPILHICKVNFLSIVFVMKYRTEKYYIIIRSKRLPLYLFIKIQTILQVLHLGLVIKNSTVSEGKEGDTATRHSYFLLNEVRKEEVIQKEALKPCDSNHLATVCSWARHRAGTYSITLLLVLRFSLST